MKIKAIETFCVTLPFRFSFGHSLATRADSTNLIVRVTLEDGTQGYGEGVPRDYVTGENALAAEHNVDKFYAPRLMGLDITEPEHVIAVLENSFFELELDKRPQGSSWCALELAVLDAVAKAHRLPITNWLGPIITPRIKYGGVIPFGGKNAQFAMLLAWKLFGFQTVKIKVGGTLEDDIAKVARARKIMGPSATLRVDANCAWNVDQTLRAAEAFAPYNVVSYEQPVPPERLDWMQKITAALPAQVLADESLCTLAQAEMLGRERICSAFNIRISKVGGWLAAQKMVAIAQRYGIKCHLGAQVGESGILSAAGRTFAMCQPPFENYEGSMNAVLLERDITSENLTVGLGGTGDFSYARKSRHGFGITISEGTLESWDVAQETALATAATFGEEVLAGKP